ncbi:hypothetical protein [Siminovitchia fortis]|nr:hypothetical protein [Siminovitchia fortis]
MSRLSAAFAILSEKTLFRMTSKSEGMAYTAADSEFCLNFIYPLQENSI